MSPRSMHDRPRSVRDAAGFPGVAPRAIFRHARSALPRGNSRSLQSATRPMLKLYSYFRSSAAYRVRIPLNNLVVLQYLKRTLDHDQATIDAWYVHWIVSGFEAIEAMIAPGPYAFGAEVTLADLCLVPQVANARRYKVPLEKFPRIVAVDAACQKLAAFEQARPENQPDAE